MRGSAAAASTRTGKRKSQRCMAGSFSQVDGETCAILHLCVKKRSTFAILSHCVSGKYVRAMVSSPICRRGCASRFVRAGDRLVRETEKSRLFHHASRLPACAGAPWFPRRGSHARLSSPCSCDSRDRQTLRIAGNARYQTGFANWRNITHGEHQKPEEAHHHQREVPHAQPRGQKRAQDRDPSHEGRRRRRQRRRGLRRRVRRVPPDGQGRLEGRRPRRSRRPAPRRPSARPPVSPR